MLSDCVLATGQIARHCYTICIGGHGTNQRAIRIEDVKLHIGNGPTIGGIRLGQPNTTLHGRILHMDGIGLSILRGFDDRSEAAVDVSVRSLNLGDGVGIVREPVGFGRSVCVSGQRCNNSTAHISNSEDRTGQCILRVRVNFGDADLAHDYLVGHLDGQELIVLSDGCRIECIIYLIAFGSLNFLNVVVTSREVCPLGNTRGIRLDRRIHRSESSIKQLEHCPGHR